MIYHITNQQLWNRALDLGSYTHASLEAEGFIHASEQSQVRASAHKHFAGAAELVVLHLVDKKIPADVVWERSPGAADFFPHIYGEIPLAAVQDVSIIMRDPETQAFDWESCGKAFL